MCNKASYLAEDYARFSQKIRDFVSILSKEITQLRRNNAKRFGNGALFSEITRNTANLDDTIYRNTQPRRAININPLTLNKVISASQSIWAMSAIPRSMKGQPSQYNSQR